MNHRHIQIPSQQPQQIYIPAVGISRITVKHSLPRLPVATAKTPDQVCGVAQRVGYTGTQDNDLAIFRLKIKAGQNLPVITLPGFFVLEQGVFIDYEQWCANSKTQ